VQLISVALATPTVFNRVHYEFIVSLFRNYVKGPLLKKLKIESREHHEFIPSEGIGEMWTKYFHKSCHHFIFCFASNPLIQPLINETVAIKNTISFILSNFLFMNISVNFILIYDHFN